MCNVSAVTAPEQPRTAKVWPSVSAQWSWVRRPVRTAHGWTGGLVMLSGAAYLVGVTYDEQATLLDFVKVLVGLHYRVAIQPMAAECDCADAVYRQRCCKHQSAAVEILDELNIAAPVANYAA